LWDGYAIDNIAQEDSISGARTGLQSFIDWLMEAYPADVVMLQIGTNDILSYYDTEHMGERLEILVDSILSHMEEDGLVYVATIPYMDASDTTYINEYVFTVESMDEIVDSYNSQIREMVARMQSEGKNVALCDINSVLTKDDLYDGVHPNAEGYAKMGAYWYDRLTEYMNSEISTKPDTEETTEQTETDSQWTLMGDVNGDGKFSLSDLVLLQKYLLGTESLDSDAMERADWNGDGSLDAFDLALLKRGIFYLT
jgi:lysophospholipase L1-like esterase